MMDDNNHEDRQDERFTPLLTIVDWGMRISVPIVVATTLGTSTLLWSLNERMVRVEGRQDALSERVAKMPPEDYRALMDERFEQIKRDLDSMARKLDKLLQQS